MSKFYYLYDFPLSLTVDSIKLTQLFITMKQLEFIIITSIKMNLFRKIRNGRFRRVFIY